MKWVSDKPHLSYTIFLFAPKLQMTSCRELRIVADDYGYCSPRDEGIRYLAKKNIIWGASLLVNGLSAAQAATLGKECGICMGLHLNLSEGKPVCDPSEVQSLLKPNSSVFGGKFYLRSQDAKKMISENEVYREICSQIESFVHLVGHPPAYVDGHQHMHIVGAVRASFVRAMKDYQILHTRLPDDPLVSKCTWHQEPALEFYKSVCQDAKETRSMLIQNGIRFCSRFLGLTTMGSNMSIEKLRLSFLQAQNMNADRDLDSGACSAYELMVHPGYPCQPWNGGCGEGPDDFGCSSEREHELTLLNSAEFQTLLCELNIRLCS